MPQIPYCSSFCSNTAWSSISNALDKSRKIKVLYRPVSLLCNSFSVNSAIGYRIFYWENHTDFDIVHHDGLGSYTLTIFSSNLEIVISREVGL